MGKKYQLHIKNTDTGPYKVPFKEGTPKEFQSKMIGVLKVGKKITVSSEIARFVNLDQLERDSLNGRIKYKKREIVDMPSKTKILPKKKVSSKKAQPLKVEEKTEVKKDSKSTSNKKKDDDKKGGN